MRNEPTSRGSAQRPHETSTGVAGWSGCDTETSMIESLTKLLLVARSRMKSRASLEVLNAIGADWAGPAGTRRD